jgi:uncharacterized membrane protein
MKTYLFQTHEFGVSSEGIHLLRSGFNYETIDWSQIKSLKIQRGKALHNWFVILVIGVALLSLGIYLSIRTIDTLMYQEHAERYVKMMQFLLIPGIGVYFIYNALRTGTLAVIQYHTRKEVSFKGDHEAKTT